MSETQMAEKPQPNATQAETDRQARLKAFAEERLERVRLAKAERAAELELTEQARLMEARDKLAGFESIDAARRAIIRARRSAHRRTRLRLALFVALPTLLVAIYLAAFATPFYEATTTFAVRAQQESQTRQPGKAGIFGISSPVGLHDAFLARAYMMSPEMLATLNAETRFFERVTGSDIDPISARRLPFLPEPMPFATFQRFVRAKVDIQAGLITLIVRAPSPAEAEAWAAKIVRLAGARIETMEQDRLHTILSQAQKDTAIAREQLRAARSTLTALQIGSGETDPYARIAMTNNLIADLESEYQAAERSLTVLRMRYSNDNTLVRRRAIEVGLIAKKLREYRDSLGGAGQDVSLAARAAAYDQASLDVELAQATWAERLRSEQVTRVEAKRNRTILSIIVAPLASDRPVAPALLQTSLLTMLVLGGIYAFLTILAASFRHHGLHR